MVRVSALFLLALGLACAVSVRGFSIEELQQDMDSFELTEVNQAVEMSNRLRNIATIMQEAEEIDALTPEKRSAADFVNKIKEFFKNGLKKVSDFFKNLYNVAKDNFQRIGSKFTFKNIVDKLMPFIEKNTSEEGCTKICIGESHKIFGTTA